MAREITLTAALEFLDNGVLSELGVKALEIDVASNVYFSGVKAITTSSTAIPQGSVALGGWVIYKNLDKTNYVEVLDSASVAFAKMLPGEVFVARTGSSFSFNLKANTATCEVQFLIINA